MMSESTCGKRHHFERICEQDEQGRKVFYWRCRDCGQEARGREEMIKHADSYYGDVTSAWDPEIMSSAEIASFEINYEIGRTAVQNIKYLPGKLICNKSVYPNDYHVDRIAKAPDCYKTVEFDITDEEDREIRRALENTDFVTWCEGGYPPLPYVEPRRNDPIGIPPPIIRFICTFANRPYTYYTRLSEGKEYEGHSIIDPLRKILERYGIAFMPVYVFDHLGNYIVQKCEKILDGLQADKKDKLSEDDRIFQGQLLTAIDKCLHNMDFPMRQDTHEKQEQLYAIICECGDLLAELEENKTESGIVQEEYEKYRKHLLNVIERSAGEVDLPSKRFPCDAYKGIISCVEGLHYMMRYVSADGDKAMQDRIAARKAELLRSLDDCWSEIDSAAEEDAETSED